MITVANKMHFQYYCPEKGVIPFSIPINEKPLELILSHGETLAISNSRNYIHIFDGEQIGTPFQPYYVEIPGKGLVDRTPNQYDILIKYDPKEESFRIMKHPSREENIDWGIDTALFGFDDAAVISFPVVRYLSKDGREFAKLYAVPSITSVDQLEHLKSHIILAKFPLTWGKKNGQLFGNMYVTARFPSYDDQIFLIPTKNKKLGNREMKASLMDLIDAAMKNSPRNSGEFARNLDSLRAFNNYTGD